MHLCDNIVDNRKAAVDSELTIDYADTLNACYIIYYESGVSELRVIKLNVKHL